VRVVRGFTRRALVSAGIPLTDEGIPPSKGARRLGEKVPSDDAILSILGPNEKANHQANLVRSGRPDLEALVPGTNRSQTIVFALLPDAPPVHASH